ncbi:alpha/beta hydrolase [Brevibacterium daeguense]|uniref:Alpha/beta hydrolase n=1 Tax=Brevibacterium daeguense TaxID=909936 RepID=A0ABP8EKV4_9MICO
MLPLPGGDRATLIAHREGRAEIGLADDCVVLYIHGWSDYFFQSHVAQFWADHGAAFYAVDLRGYGRSIDFDDPEVRPGYIEDLTEYDDELEAAMAIIEAEHPGSRLILAGHSTGGLIVSLWADRHPGRISALVLNSPWLEFQLSSATRKFITPLLQWRSRRSADSPLKVNLPNFYSQSVFQSHGRLPYDIRLKPAESFPVYPAWLAAVFAGHEAVEQGLSIDVPVLVQMSTMSMRQSTYTEEMSTADIVLNVDLLAQRAPSLGSEVVIHRIKGAMHDVFLSSRHVQGAAFAGIDRFLAGYL